MKIKKTSTQTSKGAFAGLFTSAFLWITLLYLLSAIPFTALNMRGDELSNNAYGFLYIASQMIRLLLAAALGWFIRGRSRATLSQANPKLKKMRWILLVLFMISLVLYWNGSGSRFFFTFANLLRIYPRGSETVSPMRFFLTVMWEQFFSGYFLWGLMLGFAILLIPFSAKTNPKLRRNALENIIK